MGYPQEWRDFYERHLLPREGGYVPGTGTLLGVLPRVWVDAIPNIPQNEIDAQPEWSRVRLEAIRHAGPGQRPALVREWINGVRDQLQPWGNGNGHTFEYPRAGGNAAIVSGAHNLALSVFYRQYIRGTGIEQMQVQPRIQETISDSCIRYGEGYAYSLLARAIVSSGIRSEGQLNGALLNALDQSSLPRIADDETRREVGYVPTSSIASGATYRRGEPGYVYTTGPGREAIRSLLHDLTPQQQQALFDEFGRWRRIYDANKPQVGEREGDMARTGALHGSYAEYNARRQARTAVAAQPASGTGANVALVQVRDGWLSPPEIGIELPGGGRIVYRLNSEPLNDGSGRNAYVVGDIVSKPANADVLAPNEVSTIDGSSYRFPHTRVVVWRTPDGRVMNLAIPPKLNELAIDGNPNTWPGGFVTSASFSEDPSGNLNPVRSARLEFTDASHSMTLHPPAPASSNGLVGQAQAATPPRR